MSHQRKISCQLICMVSLLTLHFMCGSVFSFRFAKDCVPSNHLSIDVNGTNWYIRSWVPKDANGTVLSLVSKNEGNSILNKFDITRTEVSTLFVKKGPSEKNTSVIAGEGISPGWQEFRVTSDSRFKVWVTGVDEPLVDVEDEVGAEKLVILGSNVTVNCREPMTIWDVYKEQETAFPLGGPGRHNLTLFSRSPSSPLVKLGAQTLEFSWDSGESRVTTFAGELHPLPAFIQHNFTVDCSHAQNHFKCDILAGQSDTLVGSVSLPEEVTSMSFQARNGQPFIVLLHHFAKDQNGSDAMEFMAADTKVFTVIAVFLNAVLGVICAMLGVKLWQMKLNPTQISLPPPYTSETVPLNGENPHRKIQEEWESRRLSTETN
ncbi:uncharacterized protein LOC122264159 isoform X2 [Penaeus japonicus]|uniref:uncharacterized protein LOC122264159 isoform X2 n=1 Tax=Penaeus japonicus TaxID=27405 RepID=UPI001C7143C4|nr:uncharacterized protein LOC122264159 isoform X2 [Penaeus japonicus]